MGWSTVVRILAERTGVVALLLNRRAELLFASPAAEQTLGLRAEEVGSNWIEQHVVASSGASARRSLERVLDGALYKVELPLRTAEGAAMAGFDAFATGPAPDGVLLVLESLKPLGGEQQLSDYDYEVTAVSSGAPKLLRVLRLGLEGRTAQGHCFEVLHGRSSPCEHCPLHKHASAGAKLAVVPRPPQGYVVTRASVDGEGAQISVRAIEGSSLAGLVVARLDELAARAGLSRRERAVFGQLMEGRSVEEMASALQIRPRTVKFHQANLLQKLGADSRSDLMRVVF